MKHLFDDKKYLCWGLTALFVIIGAILFFMILQYLPGIAGAISSVLSVLSPIIWGLVIAYLMHPVSYFLEAKAFTPLFTRVCKNKPARAPGLARTFSVLVAVLLLFLVVVALFWMLLPQLYDSIATLIINIPSYTMKVIAWINVVLQDHPELEQAAASVFGNSSESFTEWANNSLLPAIDIFGKIQGILTNITTGIYMIVRGILNALIGLIVSIYLLYNPEKFRAGGKKTVYSIFSPTTSAKILGAVRFTDRAFTGFISGKIIDSLFIGLICYIFCALAGMPYTALVSVIIGVTNIIPFFGPFIGAIPSAFIILMVSPVKCLIFIIFVIVLQQFDGNILGPKILGSAVGLNGFWIMFAIIVGGGLFGFAGMLLGVPVFTVILAGVNSLIDSSLSRRGYPADSELYEQLDHIDPETGELKQFEHKENTDPDGDDSDKAGGEKSKTKSKGGKNIFGGKR